MPLTRAKTQAVRIDGDSALARDTGEDKASGSNTVSAERPDARDVQRFGDYELLEEIARGGMGVVFKARQISLNRIVALKRILSGRLSGNEEVQGFRAEAEAAANLDHPNIVPVHEVGEQDGQHFFSMGFVDGESLADRLKDGPLPPREAVTLLKTIAEAIAYAHEKGIVHRDLKPGNILLASGGRHSEPGRVAGDHVESHTTAKESRASVARDDTARLDSPKITDFGLAKNIAADSGMTSTGQILGTPSYMPPEQAAGRTEQIGPLSDVYSLGAMLYATLTGRPPFQAANVAETLGQVLEQDPVSPRTLNTSVDRDLETICLKCLEKDPQRRYASAADLAAELDRFLAGKPIYARPVGRAERLWRWSRRNRLVAALSSTALLLLIAVAVVGMVGFALTTRALAGQSEQRVKAEENAVAAEENFQKAREFVDDYFTKVSESRELLSGTPGTQRLRKRLLERAQKYYEGFVRDRTGDEKLLGRIGRSPPQARLAFRPDRRKAESLDRLSEVDRNPVATGPHKPR